MSKEEAELRAAIKAILHSPSRKKLVIAGPGTGKTTLFKMMLKENQGKPQRRIVLTFINTLKDDLEKDLKGLAKVHTLHSYCMGLLHRNSDLSGSLSQDFRCCPGLASLIADDWEIIHSATAPPFVSDMRNLTMAEHLRFYLNRGDYYDAVDFDDSVFRTYIGLSSKRAAPDNFDLVLIDEYQDFNALEAGIIDILSQGNPILIAGDDDQALYSQLRNANWDHIRRLSKTKDFDVFELPFCMRCPRVVVDAVSDIIAEARKRHKLNGRIEKPYKYFPPVKEADSAKYPRIVDVETSVQSNHANYMGHYIAKSIGKIPQAEVDEAMRGGYPPVLVIAANPYRDQIIDYLEEEGYPILTRREPERKTTREEGLGILKEDPVSNLGWRIVLEKDRPTFFRIVIKRSAKGTIRLVDAVPEDYRDTILSQVEKYRILPATEEIKELPVVEDKYAVRVTSFEGAKGLSAQHVFIVGLHDGELPRDPNNIKDLEICKFVVGLTRTRKKCTLIHTNHFGTSWKSPSTFIRWIDKAKVSFKKIDKKYWTEH